MRLLHIESSPRQAGSASRDLASTFLRTLRIHLPDLTIVRRDLTQDPPPPIDEPWAHALFLDPAEHTEEMQASLEPSEIYIRELCEADLYVFSMPMHNFTVPANLKCYIDHSLRPGRTFAVGPKGTRGLLKGKRALVITARGGYYKEADPKSDFQEPYMRKVFSFIGVEDVHFFHAEGLDMGSQAREAGLREAAAELETFARVWAEGIE